MNLVWKEKRPMSYETKQIILMVIVALCVLIIAVDSIYVKLNNKWTITGAVEGVVEQPIQDSPFEIY